VISATLLVQQWCNDQALVGDKILGLCAPPGSGKSWLCNQLSDVPSLSIDDLYWPQPLLQQHQRGLPGSHDLHLLTKILNDFRQHGEAVAPYFDKRLAAGAGDRCGERLLKGDLLLLEGWCVGARGTPALKPYQAIWHQLDCLLLLIPPSYGRVLRWRLQAEAKQRRRGGAALTATQVVEMVQSFYAALPPQLCFQPLYQQPLLPTWLLKLDYQRRPVGALQLVNQLG
jgi:D-glycerate 3-kinase